MSAKEAELIALLAETERVIEKAETLGLPTATYLLKMALLDARKALYGDRADDGGEMMSMNHK